MATSRWGFLLLLVCILGFPSIHVAKSGGKSDLVKKVNDHKELKKILRTRNNVLIIYAENEKSASTNMAVYSEVAEEMRGLALLLLIDCQADKKVCKKMKVNPKSVELIHYKDGEFNKAYDRKNTVKSMCAFLRDPTGDIPWNEDSSASDVIHLENEKELNKLLHKNKPTLIMFYAPWCGHCKRLKPEYAAAATELKGEAFMAGMDVDSSQHTDVKSKYNVTGYPTLQYFENGKHKYKYGGENSKQGLISWLRDPQPAKEPEPEKQWADEETEVVHLTDANFDEFVAENPSVLVMFYAPWCGHCKMMKPDYTEAAAILKEEEVVGILAAVDATKERTLAEKYAIKGFPTVKYFKNGEFAWEFNERTQEKILEFMRDPKEPPPPPPPEPEWSEIENEINHLTDATFASFLKKKKHTLVMFYAPWCGHCKKAKPEFTAAADQFKDDNKVAFAAMDCTKFSEVCGKYDVSGYPTFRYFNYGKGDFKYTGGRLENDFVNFMKDPKDSPATNMPPPAATPEETWADVEGSQNLHHLSTANFNNFIKQHPSVLVMFYAPWCGHCKAMKPAYAEAATLLKEQENEGILATVDATVEVSLGKTYEVRGYPTLKYFKNGEFYLDYNKHRTANDFVSFMKNPEPERQWSEEQSAVEHLTEATFQDFLKDSGDVLVMFYAPWCGHCKAAKPLYTEAADSLLDDSSKHMAAVDCIAHSKICTDAGVTGYPTINYYKQGQFVQSYNGPRTTEGFIEFLQNQGKSAPVKDASQSDQHTEKSAEKTEL